MANTIGLHILTADQVRADYPEAELVFGLDHTWAVRVEVAPLVGNRGMTQWWEYASLGEVVARIEWVKADR